MSDTSEALAPIFAILMLLGSLVWAACDAGARMPPEPARPAAAAASRSSAAEDLATVTRPAGFDTATGAPGTF